MGARGRSCLAFLTAIAVAGCGGHGTTRRSVPHDTDALSRVTSAAVVMVAVFAIFGSLGALEFKQLGIGLAVAILLDATIVRAVLLPAVMKLLGDANWYLPRRLAWLPRVAHEPARA